MSHQSISDLGHYYESDERIWSISGHTHELESLKTYDKDIYLNCRASSNGWGTWLDRWDMTDWDVKDYRNILFDLFDFPYIFLFFLF